MDNGEVSRWKLTDEPPPSKKKSLSLEDTARPDGARRKKDKELPQESASKKKVSNSQQVLVSATWPSYNCLLLLNTTETASQLCED